MDTDINIVCLNGNGNMENGRERERVQGMINSRGGQSS